MSPHTLICELVVLKQDLLLSIKNIDSLIEEAKSLQISDVYVVVDPIVDLQEEIYDPNLSTAWD